MRTAVFSIVSPNYRPYARVLMSSVERHHPDWERFVLIVGGDAEGPGEVALDALALPNAQQFCFRYSILELNTAVKPWMFEHLFARGFDRVIYLDPDIVVFSPLVELDAPAFLTLTPHLTGFIGGDGHPSERAILQAGTYNLGFLAVARDPQLGSFLNWWKEKLEFQCVVDIARGLFVDQKWIDLAPGLFARVNILRHDGYNVAYWNLRQRTVAIDDGNATVNGEPLRFFHFSGVDPSLPKLVSKYDSLRLTDVGDAGELVERYHGALRGADFEASRGARYAFATFHDGTPVPDSARIAYRNSADLQSAAGADPFAHPELFTGMRAADKPRNPRLARLTAQSYTLMSSARPLVRLFPRPLRTKMRNLLLGSHVPEPISPTENVALPQGVNVVGYVTRDTGVGESARLCKASFEAAGLRADLVDLDARTEVTPPVRYPISIHHVNADQVPAVRAQIPGVFGASAFNIGVWHWELPEFPDVWLPSATVLDEIWAPSAFIQSALSRKLSIPVVHLPHGIAVTEIETCTPEALGVPRGRFTFLCMFDFGSVLQRKNPFGAIDAFRRAFPDDANVALLIKAGHSANHRDDYAELESRMRGVPNVYLTDRMLSRARVNGLIAACDGVVSLHHSEGFGLILAEAMALAKPVVATAWSGNTDFMNGANSCPVNYELVTLERDH
ncbi:MAG TPA: glycosyltransferase, partial [Thermoanaerobaculia bacterium]